MNIYVETNFVLELVFQQEQAASCEEILRFCENGTVRLVIPAYSLAEPHEKLTRQANNRKNLQRLLDAERSQLVRTGSYAPRINSIEDIASLLIQSNEEEKQRFTQYRDRMLRVAEIVPLTLAILTTAAAYEVPFDLKPQDALVYASVINHLRQNQPANGCFLNKNTKDFDNPDIVDDLNHYHCRMIPSFDHGYRLVQAQLRS